MWGFTVTNKSINGKIIRTCQLYLKHRVFHTQKREKFEKEVRKVLICNIRIMCYVRVCFVFMLCVMIVSMTIGISLLSFMLSMHRGVELCTVIRLSMNFQKKFTKVL